MECVGHVEIDAYAQKVLKRRWPDVPLFDDVRKFGEKEIKELSPIDLLCGGFPCQDLSVAGKQKGIHGERSGLFDEIIRIARICRPKYIVLENVANLLARTEWFGYVLGRLAEIGYDAEWEIIRASDVGAPHQRARIWIVAYPNRLRRDMWQLDGEGIHGGKPTRHEINTGNQKSEVLADATDKRPGAGCVGSSPRGPGGDGVLGLGEELAHTTDTGADGGFGVSPDATGLGEGGEDIGRRSDEDRRCQDVADAGINGTVGNKSENGDRCGTQQGSQDVAHAESRNNGDVSKDLRPPRRQVNTPNDTGSPSGGINKPKDGKSVADADRIPGQVGGHDQSDAGKGEERGDIEGRGGDHDTGQSGTEQGAADGVRNAVRPVPDITAPADRSPATDNTADTTDANNIPDTTGTGLQGRQKTRSTGGGGTIPYKQPTRQDSIYGTRSQQILESELCRIFDEFSKRLDMLDINPKPHYIMGIDYIPLEKSGGYNGNAKETRSDKKMFLLQKSFTKEEVRDTIRRSKCLPKKEVLQQKMYGTLHAKRGCPDGIHTKTGTEIPKKELRNLREYQEVGGASQRPESPQQQKRKYSDAMPQLPHQATLDPWEEGCKKEELFVLDLWQACEEIGYVPKTLSEIPQTWASLDDKEKDWVVLRISTGNPWHNEWPHTPRISSKVPHRIDRLKCLGNALVPQIAALIGSLILAAESKKQ